MTIGVTSVDIVQHLAGHSGHFVQSGGANLERLKSICNAIVSERSFYPLRVHNESPATGGKATIGLHTKRIGKVRFPNFTPDLLVLPSVLKTFAYTLPLPDETCCTCVNPGKIVAGRDVGTFMQIIADPVSHKIIRVSTMKL